MKYINPLEKINEATQKASKKEHEQSVKGDEESINEIFDSVLELASLSYAQIPTQMRDSLKIRLTKSELNFRGGKHKKITEMDLVIAANNLAEKLALPKYAKTSRSQVRMLRVELMASIPSLIGKVSRSLNHGADRIMGDDIDNEMSPAEAVCVFTVLVQQKLYNDLFQATPEEWAGKLRQWRQLRDSQVTSGKEQLPETASLQVLPENKRSDEMMNNLHNKGRSLGLEKVSELVSGFLDDLGIEP